MIGKRLTICIQCDAADLASLLPQQASKWEGIAGCCPIQELRERQTVDRERWRFLTCRVGRKRHADDRQGDDERERGNATDQETRIHVDPPVSAAPSVAIQHFLLLRQNHVKRLRRSVAVWIRLFPDEGGQVVMAEAGADVQTHECRSVWCTTLQTDASCRNTSVRRDRSQGRPAHGRLPIDSQILELLKLIS